MQVYFYKHNRWVVEDLLLATVIRISSHTRGIRADAVTETGRVLKFWLSKPDNPCGSRRSIVATDRDIPTITLQKSNFRVDIGTKVLLIPGKKGQACFPVVSAEEYDVANRKILERTETFHRKKEHRWVN